MALSEAKKRANEKWNQNNKERKNYLQDRSKAKSFIKNKATLEDLEELEILIKEKEKGTIRL